MNNSKEKTKSKKIKYFFILITFLVICAALISIYKNISVEKNIEYVNSLSNIQEPIQTKALGTINKTINNTDFEINYVDKYSISGRVVDIQNYIGYNANNKLSPKDLGISWGFLASEENYKKVKWMSYGNRFLHWDIKDTEWVTRCGGFKKIGKYFSNNHIIPSNDNIKKLINKIKKNDFVKIEGYLVNVRALKDNKVSFYWNTSTSRTDEGNGACEIIYVINVTWLEKK